MCRFIFLFFVFLVLGVVLIIFFLYRAPTQEGMGNVFELFGLNFIFKVLFF